MALTRVMSRTGATNVHTKLLEKETQQLRKEMKARGFLFTTGNDKLSLK